MLLWRYFRCEDWLWGDSTPAHDKTPAGFPWRPRKRFCGVYTVLVYLPHNYCMNKNFSETDCRHSNGTWFDRGLCVGGAMHDICNDCGQVVGGDDCGCQGPQDSAFNPKILAPTPALIEKARIALYGDKGCPMHHGEDCDGCDYELSEVEWLLRKVGPIIRADERATLNPSVPALAGKVEVPCVIADMISYYPDLEESSPVNVVYAPGKVATVTYWSVDGYSILENWDIPGADRCKHFLGEDV